MACEIRQCRICGNTDLMPAVDLGLQALTGVFPKSKEQLVRRGPLALVKCVEGKANPACGLLQLQHSYDPSELYGDNYGYRSGLNPSMVDHLQQKVKRLLDKIPVVSGDLMIDIGSNDATLLKSYPEDKGLLLVGIDPTGTKFRSYYPPHIRLIPDFFKASVVRAHLGAQKAKVITSIAMFYDLESPLEFMTDIYEVLDDDGVWAFEQSYMPTMLRQNAYDTICHEHLEYYRLQQIVWMAQRAHFKILDVEFNDTNGGSFYVWVAKARSSYLENTTLVEKILEEERHQQLDRLKPYRQFQKRVDQHRESLPAFIRQVNAKGEKIFGYGASTKGNVVLQFCGLTPADIPCIAEVNADKFGCYTPGTQIPIVSEKQAREQSPDYFLVLPWHFRNPILLREQAYLQSGGRLVFPLPSLDVVHGTQAP